MPAVSHVPHHSSCARFALVIWAKAIASVMKIWRGHTMKIAENAYGHFQRSIYRWIEAGNGYEEYDRVSVSTSPPSPNSIAFASWNIQNAFSRPHRLKYEPFPFLQVFILSLPARVAAVWFGPDQVSSACSIGVFGNQVSVCIIQYQTYIY